MDSIFPGVGTAIGKLGDMFKGPDTSGVNDAARSSAQLGRDQFEWFKEEYGRTQGARDAAEARANEVSGAQLEAMKEATGQAREYAERNRTVFQPREDRILSDADAFDTAGRRQGASDAAVAGVENRFGSAQDAMTRAIRRTGGSTGGRAMALMQDVGLQKAKAAAGASTQAVNNIEQQGYARRMDAIGLGKGIVGNQATMQQIASQNGAGALGASNAALGANYSGQGIMAQGFDGAMRGNQIAGQLYGQAAKAEGDANAGAMGAVGSVAGAALMFF